MEPETFCTKEKDHENIVKSIETSHSEEDMAKKLSENNVEVDVMSVETGQPAIVVHEVLAPDITLLSYEVQQGYRIFRELLSDQYKSITYPFIQPVDVEGLNLWDYHARIETAMSFSQIESKFKSYEYESITAVVSDMRLILENCYRYNGSSHWISKLAHKLEKVLDQKLALLNRSLRDKVTLRATMAFRNKKEINNIEQTASGDRPRRSGRTSFVANGINSEQHSSLMNHLLMEEEENQREMKRIKEKEKREANEALMQELNEWENEIFSNNVLTELKSMWEVPSIGSFLWLFQTALNLPELNYTEFEYGLVLPHKSQQMAWIFTSLLVTPSQRKSIHKKSPMKFKVWERKLKEHMDIWYLATQDEELQMVARQIGLNHTFFEILGETNPLETKSYIDLTLHQRVLILKVLCEECLDYHPQLRDFLGNTDTTPSSETYLGYDGRNSRYLYFPVFDATDIRIYKQAELPALNEWYRKWSSNSKAVSSFPGRKRTSQSKSRRSSTSKKSKKSKMPASTIETGFELVCNDVESLRGLCGKFAEQPPMPSRRKSGGRPPTRKRCEKDLHNVLSGLVEDLARNDARYSRARVKGMLNLMRDWKSVEPDSGDELNAQDEKAEESAVGDLHTPLDNQTTNIPDSGHPEEILGEEGAPLLSIVTRSRKRKFLDYDEMASVSSSPVSEISKNFESEIGDDGCPVDKSPNLDNSVVQDLVMKSSEICDVIVRDVVHDVIRSVVDDVICDVVDDAISKVSVCEYADVATNGVDSDGLVGTTVTQDDKEGQCDEKMRVNGLEIKYQNEDHARVYKDNKGQLLNNGDSMGNRDTAMDTDGFEDTQSRGTCDDNMTNGSTLMINGDEHREQNIDARNTETEIEIGSAGVNEHPSSVTYSGQNCNGSQGINTSVTYDEGNGMYHNGEYAANACESNTDSHNLMASTKKVPTSTMPTGNRPTEIIPAIKETTRMIPTGKQPTRVIPAGIKSTVYLPEQNGSSF